MECPEIELGGAVIYNAGEDVRRFIDEWNNELPYIIAHTSGSTGTPKTIRLLKDDMRRSAVATCRYFNITDSSVMVLPLSIGYIAGKMMVIRALEAKARLWIESPSNKPLVRDYGTVDLLPVVPSQVEWIVSNPECCKKIRNIIVGGGAMPVGLECRLAESGINAYATYGMTETCSHVALRRVGDESSCYNALPGITFATDERGCLVIDAPQFSFGRIVTNDIVTLVDENRFRWMGRWDNVINTGGVKVFPEKIEQAISASVSLPPFYVTGRKSEKWGEEVVMYVECAASEIDADGILSALKEEISRYELPKEIIPVPAFSRTESGKIRRLLL